MRGHHGMTKSNTCFSILTLDFGRTMVVIFIVIYGGRGGFAAVFGNFPGVFSLCFTVRPQPVPSPQIQPNEPYCESSLR